MFQVHLIGCPKEPDFFGYSNHVTPWNHEKHQYIFHFREPVWGNLQGYPDWYGINLNTGSSNYGNKWIRLWDSPNNNGSTGYSGLDYLFGAQNWTADFSVDYDDAGWSSSRPLQEEIYAPYHPDFAEPYIINVSWRHLFHGNHEPINDFFDAIRNVNYEMNLWQEGENYGYAVLLEVRAVNDFLREYKKIL